MKVKRYAIIGGRPPKNPIKGDEQYYANLLLAVEEYVNQIPINSTVISGGAQGVDLLAVECAKKRGINFVEYLPDYKNYPGAIAPLIRNKLIVDDCDILVAFPTHWSTGTWHAINLARLQEKEVYIHSIKPNEY